MVRQKTYEDLIQPLKPGSWEALKWGTTAWMMRKIGVLSEGMRIGYRYGFDSGKMLDYIYRNEARGSLGIGWVIDRTYLNAVGWRGIRQRKVHLQMLLKEVILKHKSSQRAVHIVDVASGPGRYLLETLKEIGQDGILVTLRDWDKVGLSEARTLAQKLGLTGIRTERGDAFDPENLRKITPTPQIIIVSGLYELFPDNARILRSLRGIYDLLEVGGDLIYTNQPTHPQVEMIARCLPNREGKPWVMRLRSQEEMDQLVIEAGFHPLQILVDKWGVFTVSVSRKEGPR